jgi:DNA-binding Lrp family transcriptional regulator
MIRTFYQKLIEKECPTPIKMVAEMTGMPYASVKRIIKLSEEEVVRDT